MITGRDHPYSYNGKEFEESFNMNTFDLGARHFDPALGRFFVSDPMADFMPYQSPYSFGGNNPIALIDAYGLGPKPPRGKNWLSFIFGGIKNIGKGRNHRDRLNRRLSWNKIKIGPLTKKGGNGEGTEGKREMITPINSISKGIADIGGLDIDVPSIGDLDVPKPPVPKFRGRNIKATVKFEEQVGFSSNSDEFKKSGHSDKTLNDLVKTLKEYPQLTVLILGNSSSNSKPDGRTLNSSSTLNGRDVTLRDLQLARARAIEKFLIGRGINWRRVNVGNGEIRFEGESGRTTSFILKNNK